MTRRRKQLDAFIKAMLKNTDKKQYYEAKHDAKMILWLIEQIEKGE